MNPVKPALQVVRVVVLLGLLYATGEYVQRTIESTMRLEADDLWSQWFWISLIMVGFIAVALIGRQRRHSLVVLLLEAVVAAGLAFIPPLQWIVWFGVDHDWIHAATGGYVQPLAVAWLGIAVATAMWQLRRPETRTPWGGSSGSETQAARDSS